MKPLVTGAPRIRVRQTGKIYASLLDYAWSEDWAVDHKGVRYAKDIPSWEVLS